MRYHQSEIEHIGGKIIKSRTLINLLLLRIKLFEISFEDSDKMMRMVAIDYRPIGGYYVWISRKNSKIIERIYEKFFNDSLELGGSVLLRLIFRLEASVIPAYAFLKFSVLSVNNYCYHLSDYIALALIFVCSFIININIHRI